MRDQRIGEFGRKVGRQVRRQVGRQVGRQVSRLVGWQEGRQVDRQVCRQIGTQVRRQVGRWVGRQMGRQVGRQVAVSLEIDYQTIYEKAQFLIQIGRLPNYSNQLSFVFSIKGQGFDPQIIDCGSLREPLRLQIICVLNRLQLCESSFQPPAKSNLTNLATLATSG